MTERNRWLALLVLPPLFWAGNALVGRAVVGDIPPVGLSFWRWVLALVVILPFTARSILNHADVLKANWRVVVALGVFSVTAYNTLLYLALQTTTAINATLVGTSLPLMVLVLARLWLDEPIRARQAAGIGVSGLGLVAVVAKGDPTVLARLEFTPGDLLMLVATLSWSIYSVMLRRHPLPVPGLTLLAVLIAVGLVGIAPLYAWELALGLVFVPSAEALGAIAYTAVFASLLAYYFWNRGVAAVGAAVAGQFTYLIPLFASV
ncbi:MAG TPA: DMT family transporter, partial [Candidatus Omnitrophota bacterium]|nr:DMT family transporter [Candidatus Omnitrophota bacterium]